MSSESGRKTSKSERRGKVIAKEGQDKTLKNLVAVVFFFSLSSERLLENLSLSTSTYTYGMNKGMCAVCTTGVWHH